MESIKFSNDYPKLEDATFTTIRRYDNKKLKPGQTVLIKTPTSEFKAVILVKWKECLDNMSDRFLMTDTCTDSRYLAVKLLNSFYRKPIQNNGLLTVYRFRKVPEA